MSDRYRETVGHLHNIYRRNEYRCIVEVDETQITICETEKNLECAMI